jgi:3D (Asp-Asp-Asp) domain-containing protein
VAVDPAVIPLGSDVLVDYGDGGGLQYYRADDTGFGVDGKAIDFCVASHAEALQLGRRTATVYFVPPGEVQ